MDKGKGQQDQQVNSSGYQNAYGEGAAQIAFEGDITESQGRHYSQGPVDSSHPGVIAVFLHHEEVKKYAVDGDDTGQYQQQLKQ